MDEEIGNEILDQRRKEENYERKLRRYHIASIDSLTYEGIEFADLNSPSVIYEKRINEMENKKLLEEIMKNLTKTEKRRILLRAEGKKYEEIAMIENVKVQSVYESIKKAKEKAKKIKNSFKKIP